MSARKTGSIRKVTSVLLVVNAVLVLAAFAAHLLRLLALRESQELYNYCILVQALFLLVFEICIYPKHKDDMRHRLFLLSMIFAQWQWERWTSCTSCLFVRPTRCFSL